MSKLSTAIAVMVSCAFASGQSFECYPAGAALPNDPTFSCEGVVCNNVSIPFSGVTATPSCGFPTAGANYVILRCNGPVNVGNGGPFPWPNPAAPAATELRVPIPTGATTISFDWEYFNAEGLGSFYNDGFAVGVMSGGGVLLQQLVYADNQQPLGICASSGTEVAPAGVQSFVGILPPITACDYVAMVCWNSGDNVLPGAAFVDNIVFNSTLPACSVPCFVQVGGTPTVGFSSPSGFGCIQVTLANLPGSGVYFLPVSLVQGAFPNGWFFGIDIGFQELADEINAGYPFIGPLTGSSCSTTGGAIIGEFCGLPSGLTLYAVGLGVPLGSSYPSVQTAPVSYTIP